MIGLVASATHQVLQNNQICKPLSTQQSHGDMSGRDSPGSPRQHAIHPPDKPHICCNPCRQIWTCLLVEDTGNIPCELQKKNEMQSINQESTELSIVSTLNYISAVFWEIIKGTHTSIMAAELAAVYHQVLPRRRLPPLVPS